MLGTIDGWTKVHPYKMDRTDGSFVEVKKELQVIELRVSKVVKELQVKELRVSKVNTL